MRPKSPTRSQNRILSPATTLKSAAKGPFGMMEVVIFSFLATILAAVLLPSQPAAHVDATETNRRLADEVVVAER